MLNTVISNINCVQNYCLIGLEHSALQLRCGITAKSLSAAVDSLWQCCAEFFTLHSLVSQTLSGNLDSSVLKDGSNFLPLSSILKRTQNKTLLGRKFKSSQTHHQTSQTQQSSASSLENKDVVHATDLHNFKWQSEEKTNPLQVITCSEENSDSGISRASKQLEFGSAFREHITTLVDFTAFFRHSVLPAAG